MRNLITKDLFALARIIKKLGVKEILKKAIDEGLSNEDAGSELIIGILTEFPEVEQDVYEFIAGPLELPPSDIANMDPFELVDNLAKLKEFVPAEKWKAFTSALLKLIR